MALSVSAIREPASALIFSTESASQNASDLLARLTFGRLDPLGVGRSTELALRQPLWAA